MKKSAIQGATPTLGRATFTPLARRGGVGGEYFPPGLRKEGTWDEPVGTLTRPRPEAWRIINGHVMLGIPV